MTIIRVTTETFSLAHIKAHLSEVVDRVEHQHDRVVLTRNGRPAAILVSPDDLEAIEDTLDVLSDPQALKEINQAPRRSPKAMSWRPKRCEPSTSLVDG